jgi:hypothetical protein
VKKVMNEHNRGGLFCSQILHLGWRIAIELITRGFSRAIDTRSFSRLALAMLTHYRSMTVLLR